MANIKVSICITLFNEAANATRLIDSLIKQTKKPDEIVIVDGGSRDRTKEIILEYKKRYKKIRAIFKKCSRAKGRNIGIKAARYPIIAITDGGCVADRNWLKRITEPFKNKDVDIVAGFYRMDRSTSFKKAESVFLGVLPSQFNSNFLPSTRSIAFTKKTWKKIGGFPESKRNSAEDTDFNYKAVKLGMKYVRVKNAIVEWGIPEDIMGFLNKIYSYAKWDAGYGIWWNPVQKSKSHNIKAFFIFFRYLIGLAFIYFYLIFENPLFLISAILALIIYMLWAFKKAGHWGVVLQITSDLAVMAGFISGIIS